MTSTFPLYDTLYHKVQHANIGDPEITSSQKKAIISFIDSSQEHIHELVYVLIRMYQLQHDSAQSFILPYGGKKTKKGIKFNLNKFPHTLSHIIYQFVLTHTNTLETTS